MIKARGTLSYRKSHPFEVVFEENAWDSLAVVERSRIVGDGVLILVLYAAFSTHLGSNQSTSARVDIGRRNHAQEVLKDCKCYLSATSETLPTMRCGFKTHVQRLRNGRKEWSKRELVNDVREVHDWCVSNIPRTALTSVIRMFVAHVTMPQCRDV